jgi:ketosteroid isomerase-like protein
MTDVSVDRLAELVDAFNEHDLDRIMRFFAEDCVLLMPQGPDPWGLRYDGIPEVRKGLASRFEGLPDAHFGDDHHWVSENLGVSTWLLTGTRRSGERLKVRGVDLFEFDGSKIVKKDSYWKIVQSN